jgi:psp operon transcriptional activator
MARQLSLEYFSGFSPLAVEQLMMHSWPGNIRELKNVVERSVYREGADGQEIDHIILDPFASPYRPVNRVKTRERQLNQIEHAPTPVTESAELNIKTETSVVLNSIEFPIDFKEYTENSEIELLQRALAEGQYNQKKTADLLGLSYHQLRGILKKYNLLDKS